MMIKRFEGDDLKQTLQRIEDELGPDAVILQTRKLRDLGPGGRPRMEVLAAVDEGAEEASAPVVSGKNSEAENGKAERESRIAALRRRLTGQDRGHAENGTTTKPGRPGAAGDPGGAPSDDPLLVLHERVLWELETGTIELCDDECLVVALVGPTGTGKSTTALKLTAAAHAAGHRAALVRCGTRASADLDVQARRLGLPTYHVDTDDEARRLRDVLNGFQLAVVDTPGLSPARSDELRRLHRQLRAISLDQVHLVVDARLGLASLRASQDAFRTFQPTHTIVTKLDEAPCLMDPLRAVLESRLPVAYLTSGQSIADDLRPADPQFLARRLLRVAA
jgi:flagellar biosynthesis protein FlhF